MAARTAASRVVATLVAAVRLVTSVVGGLMVLYAGFVLLEANPANPMVEFTAGVRNDLGGFTIGLFNPDGPKIAETVNALVAAIIWFVVGNLLTTVITRLAPRRTSKA